MIRKIRSILFFTGATLVAAHCLIGGAAFAQLQDDGQPCPPECVTDSLEIVTWYPSPYNEYEELRLYPISDPNSQCSDANRGLMYYDSDEDKVKLCKGPAGFNNWQALSYWDPSTINTDDIYYNTGNVGIGTTAPLGALQVVGTLANVPTAQGVHIGQVSNYYGLQLYGSAGGLIDFNDGSGEDADFRIIEQSGRLDIGAGSAPTGMTILSSGNVGIGTTSPVEKLDVDGLIKIKFYGSVPSDSDNGPEAYRVTDGGPPCDSSHRGSITVMRPSGAGPQDALCFCGDIAGTYMWSCFNL